MEFTEIKVIESYGLDEEYNKEVTICVDRSGMTFYDMVDNIIRPMLFAQGYSPDLVNECVPDTNEIY